MAAFPETSAITYRIRTVQIVFPLSPPGRLIVGSGRADGPQEKVQKCVQTLLGGEPELPRKTKHR